MSIIQHLEEEGVWILDHADHIEKTYAEVGLRPRNIFDVKSPFYMDLQAKKLAQNLEDKIESLPKKNRKRKSDKSVQSPDSDFVRKKFENLRESMRTYFDAPPNAAVLRENNSKLRELSSRLLNLTNHQITTSGSNDSATCQLIKVEDSEFVIPPKSRYIVDNLKNFESKIFDKKFELILLDPPWENKHVKRVNRRDTNSGTVKPRYMMPL